MILGLYALVLGLCGCLKLHSICAQGEYCASGTSDLIEDESISRCSGPPGTRIGSQGLISSLDAIIAKAEQAKEALDAAIATGKAHRQQLKVPRSLKCAYHHCSKPRFSKHPKQPIGSDR